MHPLAFCRLLITCSACLQSPGCIWVGEKSVSPCRGGSLQLQYDGTLSSNPQVIQDLKDCPGGFKNTTNQLFPRVTGRFTPRICHCPPVDCPKCTPDLFSLSSPQVPLCLHPTKQQCEKWIPKLTCHQEWYNLTIIKITGIAISIIVGILFRPYVDKFTLICRQQYTRISNTHALII